MLSWQLNTCKPQRVSHKWHGIFDNSLLALALKEMRKRGAKNVPKLQDVIDVWTQINNVNIAESIISLFLVSYYWIVVNLNKKWDWLFSILSPTVVILRPQNESEFEGMYQLVKDHKYVVQDYQNDRYSESFLI